MKRSVAALAIGLATGCATAGAPAAHASRQPSALAHPEPDPACLGVVSQCPAIGGLQQVVMKVGVSREGRVAFLEVLTPDLTTADTVEIRRALEGCVWKPALDANGQKIEGTFTLAIER